MEEDARRRFFSGMSKERAASEDFRDVDEIDFSITESGRTVAHMGTESLRSETDFSIGGSSHPGEGYMLTEVERDDLLKTLQDEIPIGGRNSGNHHDHAKPRPIPVPKPTQSAAHIQPPSQASSQGSSGSAFLSSVLNPTAGTFNNTQLSHTPPTFGTSYEAFHFGKRARSGSISGRLRSASEYLEERGLLDRQTKGILKDLIIIGDEDLQRAIDSYESGDPSKLEEMINSGALQNRLPGDIDILDDIDLDFLHVGDEIGMGGEIEPLRNDQGSTDRKPAPVPSKPTSSQYAAFHPGQVHSHAVSPPENDDGIGDLEFSGDLVSDQAEYLQLQPQSYGSKEPSVAASPAEASELSEYEQRMRSNSLFSALLNEPRLPLNKTAATSNEFQYGNWMDHSHGPGGVQQGMNVGRPNQNLPTNRAGGGIGASLEAERKRLEKLARKEKREKTKQEKDQQRKSLEAEDIQEHVSGSGLPRTLSDPNLHSSIDEDGLVQVDRPEGWVGAYSPESRKVRIERFLQKRHNRVWAKTVKYDVRKNFADSRLRVKGRFVKKEDELLMRELMSLT